MVRRDFECIQCGNCCPANEFCGHRVGNLCDVHPSIVGEEIAGQSRGIGCGDPPSYICGGWGFYCPPVIKAFENETGITLHPLYQSRGDVVINEWTKEPEKIKKLHQFLGIKKTFWSK